MADLFSDGFESGDLTAWDATEIDGGDLSAHADAKLHGNYGLKCFIDDTNSIYVLDLTPSSETRYRFRFYIDPNTLNMAEGSNLYFATDDDALAIDLYYIDGAYNIKFCAYKDSGSLWSSAYVITDEPHCIELDWKASTGAGQNNGFCSLWIDGVLKETIANIDNDLRRVDAIVLGVWYIDGTISGTLYLDDFASNNDGNEIGVIGGTNYPQSVAGIFISTGIIKRGTAKKPVGTLTFSGLIRKDISVTRTGILVFSGVVNKGIKQTLLGILAFSGVVNKGIKQSVSGILTFTGSILKNIGKNILGSLTFSGSILKAIAKNIKGVLTFSGILSRQGIFKRTITGILTFSGTISRPVTLFIELYGNLRFSGRVQKGISKTLTGILIFRGILRKLGWNRLLKTALSWSAITKMVTSWTARTKPTTEWTETTKTTTEWIDD